MKKIILVVALASVMAAMAGLVNAQPEGERTFKVIVAEVDPEGKVIRTVANSNVQVPCGRVTSVKAASQDTFATNPPTQENKVEFIGKLLTTSCGERKIVGTLD